MLDIKWIIKNLDKFKTNLEYRQFDSDSVNKTVESIVISNERIKQLREELESAQHQRHANSNIILSSNVANEREEVINRGKELNLTITAIETQLEEVEEQLSSLLGHIPNILQLEVPAGKDEAQNTEIKRYDIVGTSHHSAKDSVIKTHIINSKGEPILDHIDILKKFDLIELEKTVAMSGSRFVTLKRLAAKLERALANFMLDINISAGFIEHSPPYMVNNQAMYKAGHLPKFEQDSFATTTNHRLIPTSEVCLVNLAADKIFKEDELPLRMTAHTPCFRSEAGSAGKDTKGLIRLHQFSKVELVTICKPETSNQEHQIILETAERILQVLDLPYRVMLLCSGDTGLWSSKTYDIEVWFPSQNKYREISSCSNCTDYQSRRLKSRYKNVEASKNFLTHTLNGSSLPIGRTLAAIVENYMDYDNSCIRIPSALIPYFGSNKIDL